MKAQFTRSARPAGATRCSRTWASPRTAAAPPRVPRARDHKSISASLRDRGVNRRRRGVHAGVRGIEVPGPEAPDVEANHLRVLLRDPHHDRMDDGHVEDREQDGGDVEADAEDERERGRHLEHHHGGLRPGEEHRPVERGVDHVRLERRRPFGGHRARSSRLGAQTVAPTNASALTMFAAPIMIARPTTAWAKRRAPSSWRVNAQSAPPTTKASAPMMRAVGPLRLLSKLSNGPVQGIGAPPPADAATATCGRSTKARASAAPTTKYRGRVRGVVSVIRSLLTRVRESWSTIARRNARPDRGPRPGPDR